MKTLKLFAHQSPLLRRGWGEALSTFILLLLFAVPAYPQKLDIDWIELTGDKVIVHYNLEDANPNHQYLISLLCSKDNYAVPLARVTGDVGQEVKSGIDKKVIWDITKELGAFKGNISFELRGRVFVPFVKLSHFDAAKVYKRGKNYPIIWTSGNLSGQVMIELFRGQERVWGESNVPNVGKYDWFIEGSAKKGNDYRLKFTNTKDRNEFVYSGLFTIKPKVPLLVKTAGLLVIGGGIVLAVKFLGGGGDGPPPTPDPLPGITDPDGN